jgi:hypothetical protein
LAVQVELQVRLTSRVVLEVVEAVPRVMVELQAEVAVLELVEQLVAVEACSAVWAFHCPPRSWESRSS